MEKFIEEETDVEYEGPIWIEIAAGFKIIDGCRELAFLPKSDGWTRDKVQTICDIAWV